MYDEARKRKCGNRSRDFPAPYLLGGATFWILTFRARRPRLLLC